MTIALFSLILFSSALFATMLVIAHTLVPALPRVIGLLTNGVDPLAVDVAVGGPHVRRRSAVNHAHGVGGGVTLRSRGPAAPQRAAA